MMKTFFAQTPFCRLFAAIAVSIQAIYVLNRSHMIEGFVVERCFAAMFFVHTLYSVHAYTRTHHMFSAIPNGNDRLQH